MSKKAAKETRAEKTAENRAVVGEYLPVSPSKVNLANPESIRQEMARVYREARGGKLDPADATKLVYMLSQIGKLYELSVIEQRLQLLEDNQRATR